MEGSDILLQYMPFYRCSFEIPINVTKEVSELIGAYVSDSILSVTENSDSIDGSLIHFYKCYSEYDNIYINNVISGN